MNKKDSELGETEEDIEMYDIKTTKDSTQNEQSLEITKDGIEEEEYSQRDE